MKGCISLLSVNKGLSKNSSKHLGMGKSEEFRRFTASCNSLRVSKLPPCNFSSTSILTPPNHANPDKSSDEDFTSRYPNSASDRRWKPTVDQLAILEDVYNRGIQSPTSDQIDQITLILRIYGEIQGNNVFQNHKRSDKQKRKRDTDHEATSLTTKKSSSSSNAIAVKKVSMLLRIEHLLQSCPSNKGLI